MSSYGCLCTYIEFHFIYFYFFIFIFIFIFIFFYYFTLFYVFIYCFPYPFTHLAFAFDVSFPPFSELQHSIKKTFIFTSMGLLATGKGNGGNTNL
jgi:hypothetical protein